MKFVKIAKALLATCMAANAKDDSKCYAVAFSSGDNTAVYQAGVLQALAAGDANRQYSAVSGISGGAVSAGILASYEKGDDEHAAERILKFWQDAANSKLYKDWIGGIT